MYDILIYCVGYEERSGYLPLRAPASARVALVFSGPHVLHFHENLKCAAERNDLLVPEHELDTKLPASVSAILERISNRPVTQGAKVLLDVSSMSRRMMATVLHYLLVTLENPISLTINYSVGAYQPPPPEEPSFLDFGPAPYCEGWTTYPERPLSVVTGLGYEVDQAVGAIEFLDPSGIWAFVPVGPDMRFLADLQRANENLWPLLDKSHRRYYRLTSPYQLFSELRGLTAALSRRSRVVIVPGGPKFFSALAIIIKFELGEEVAVWRASTNEFTPVRNVVPAGDLVQFEYKRPRARSADSVSVEGRQSVA